jgi:hypothetical protein
MKKTTAFQTKKLQKGTQMENHQKQAMAFQTTET